MRAPIFLLAILPALGCQPDLGPAVDVYDWRPTWSPDGTRIAYASERDGDYDIIVANADGSQPRAITSSDSSDWRPRWSPDGQWIAFSSDRYGQRDLFKVRPDGSDLTRLTDSPGGDEDRMSWSPDQPCIAFDSDRSGNWEVYVQCDGEALRQITDAPGFDGYPDWSPDGSRLAYFSSRDGNGEIYELDLTTGIETRLTNHRDWDFMPEYAPDGRRLAFDSRRDGLRSIWILDLDTSQLTKVTNTTHSPFVEMARRNPARALKRLEHTLERNPDADLFWDAEVFNLAFDLAPERPGDATALMEMLIRADSSEIGNWLAYGDLLMEMGEKVAAESKYEMVLALDETNQAGIAGVRRVKAD